MKFAAVEYPAINELLKHEALPAFLVDLDALDRNIDRIKLEINRSGKKMRIASKSIRVPELMKYIMNRGGEAFQGVLCFSIDEAIYLSKNGFKDLVVAYPQSGQGELRRAVEAIDSGQPLTLMVDHPEQIRLLESVAAECKVSRKIPVALDIDLSYRIFGIHLGVQRSSIRTLKTFINRTDQIHSCKHLTLDGVMGYEAHIAGVTDQNPYKSLLNPIIQFLKRIWISDVAVRRNEIAKYLKKKNISLRFFNGGGSGSLNSTLKEPWITEVTAGSGFLQSQLFDYYLSNRNEAAGAFALRVTRAPESGIVTCHGGGFIASGETGPDRSPTPYLPEGMKTISAEGFGEVQTPVRHPSLKVGDAALFRPAKSGEIAEHFSEYLLFQSGKIVSRAKTYRGDSQIFY